MAAAVKHVKHVAVNMGVEMVRRVAEFGHAVMGTTCTQWLPPSQKVKSIVELVEEQAKRKVQSRFTCPNFTPVGYYQTDDDHYHVKVKIDAIQYTYLVVVIAMEAGSYTVVGTPEPTNKPVC